jgi:hypothetical protein
MVSLCASHTIKDTLSAPLLTISSVCSDDTMDEKNLAKPDHAKAVNLARRYTAQNENDLMRKCIMSAVVLKDLNRSHPESSNSFCSQRRACLVRLVYSSHFVYDLRASRNAYSPLLSFSLYR